MKHVHCTIIGGQVNVWRESRLIGVVTANLEGAAGEPVLTVYTFENSMEHLTFNDLDIIQDNWNQLQEMQKK